MHIVVGYDGSNSSERAIELAKKHANAGAPTTCMEGEIRVMV